MSEKKDAFITALRKWNKETAERNAKMKAEIKEMREEKEYKTKGGEKRGKPRA